MGVDIQPVVKGKVAALDKVAAFEDMQYQVHILQLDKQVVVHIHMMEEEPAAVAVRIPQQLM